MGFGVVETVELNEMLCTMKVFVLSFLMGLRVAVLGVCVTGNP